MASVASKLLECGGLQIFSQKRAILDSCSSWVPAKEEQTTSRSEPSNSVFCTAEPPISIRGEPCMKGTPLWNSCEKADFKKSTARWQSFLYSSLGTSFPANSSNSNSMPWALLSAMAFLSSSSLKVSSSQAASATSAV